MSNRWKVLALVIVLFWFIALTTIQFANMDKQSAKVDKLNKSYICLGDTVYFAMTPEEVMLEVKKLSYYDKYSCLELRYVVSLHALLIYELLESIEKGEK